MTNQERDEAMREPLDAAADILARAQTIGARCELRGIEVEFLEARDHTKRRVVQLLANHIADQLAPVRERFIVTAKLPREEGPGVEFRSEMVVMTDADFTALCQAVRLAKHHIQLVRDSALRGSLVAATPAARPTNQEHGRGEWVRGR